jgi:hypothetical protein
VEDLLPRPKVDVALGDRHQNLPVHDLPFQVGVGIVFAQCGRSSGSADEATTRLCRPQLPAQSELEPMKTSASYGPAITKPKSQNTG